MDETAYTIQYGRRKRTIALTVRPDGEVVVLAPKFVSSNFISRFVAKKSEWIRKRRLRLKAAPQQHRPLEFMSGEAIYLFGKSCRLKIHRQSTLPISHVHRRGSRIHVTVSADETNPRRKIMELLRGWLTEKAAAFVLNHLDAYKKHLGVSPSRIKIVSAGKRWGSCSKSGSLRFNWKLSMMPPAVFHYVIVHEMCHMKELNHSHRFWSHVESILPDYKSRRKWLRAHGAHLWSD